MGLAELRNSLDLRIPEARASYRISGGSLGGRKLQLSPKCWPRATGGDSRISKPDSDIAESGLACAPIDAIERYRAN